MALAHRVGWDPQLTQRSEWLWPLARVARRLRAYTDFPTLAQLDALYEEEARARGAQALCFRPDVRGKQKPPLEARYDARIALRGEVPTRERHWHDLLNALCFATFPASKLALHTRQWHALERAGGPKRARAPEQDALTLFDEGGVAIPALAAVAPALEQALAVKQVAALAAEQAAGRARVVPFGHALFEHLVEGAPCPGASARVLAFETLPEDEDALIAAVDAALARELARADRFQKPREAAHLRLEELARVEVAPSTSSRRPAAP